MKNEPQTENQEYKPFISADRIEPELSAFAIISGVALAVLFGAANAYLGLRVGMTISASIPAAVISMGLTRILFKRDSILENNMVQTIGSSGECVAAGLIFTIPVLFLWFSEWGRGVPDYFLVSAVALSGGILGVTFMIPLRRSLIVREHARLPFPEGTACAEVLLAGEKGGDKVWVICFGLCLSLVYKFVADGLKLFPSEVDWSLNYKGLGFGLDVLPALLGVGFIVGPRVSSYLFSGGILGWFFAMPLIYSFGSLSEKVIYPANVLVGELEHWGLWSFYIRYIGAGAVALGGLFSLILSIPTILSTFKGAMGRFELQKNKAKVRTDSDISLKVIIILSLAVILSLGLTSIVPVGLFGALTIAIFGFFFVAVSSRVVGLVGSSNSPVSGMTIAALIITAFLFKLTGSDGPAAMIAIISVGGIICVATAVAADISQDLKTGFLIGATPRLQQIGQIIGAVATSVAAGGILILLDRAWGFGSPEIPAPQATLMKLVVEGVMGGNLPWDLVLSGAALAIALAMFRLPILPIAIGLYLPIHLSVPMIIGGLVRLVGEGLTDSDQKSAATLKARVDKGVLFSSGLIAGEGLVGILLAFLAAIKVNVSIAERPVLGNLTACLAFGLLCLVLVKVVIPKKGGQGGESINGS
ncbi:MAG: oligopeptide transporter, OPT family [Deltaproteobacteria bacterium]|jgi:putative OPT family oligopeptide transporter|nr:oligopeptide transporter, OPT family [Deltaproteobacteria bacterium]